MSYKSLLTVVNEPVAADGLRQILENSNKNDMHLAVQIFGIAPPNPVYSYGLPPHGGVIIPDDWSETIQEGAQRVLDSAQIVEKSLQKMGVSGSVVTSYCERGWVEVETARSASVADLVVLSRKGLLAGDIWPSVLSGILFRSPVPVLIGNSENDWALDAKNVFVACNVARESMRAIHQALPILKQANQVTLGIFDPVINEDADGEDPGTDVAAWLSRHGCKVDVQQYPSGGLEIGEAIKKRAFDLGADLVVMGAYGHSKLRQRIFGGTTTTMLEQQKLPLFLSH